LINQLFHLLMRRELLILLTRSLGVLF
jgi:hypothetical protein